MKGLDHLNGYSRQVTVQQDCIELAYHLNGYYNRIDEAALAKWATPFAGLPPRPMHISAKEYYSLPGFPFYSFE
jgi:hypothetical protein